MYSLLAIDRLSVPEHVHYCQIYMLAVDLPIEFRYLLVRQHSQQISARIISSLADQPPKHPPNHPCLNTSNSGRALLN